MSWVPSFLEEKSRIAFRLVWADDKGLTIEQIVFVLKKHFAYFGDLKEFVN